MSKEQILKADVNQDGAVTVADYNLLLDVANNLRDVDNDGNITTADAIRLSQIIRAAELDVTADDILRSDIDGDDNVTQADIDITLAIKSAF